MTPIIASVIVSGCGFILSVLTSAVIVGIGWGRLTTRVEEMGKDVAEIKGMFRLKLRDET